MREGSLPPVACIGAALNNHTLVLHVVPLIYLHIPLTPARHASKAAISHLTYPHCFAEVCPYVAVVSEAAVDYPPTLAQSSIAVDLTKRQP